MVAAVTFGAAFIPVKSLDCPTWDVWVADQSGVPVPGATVRLICRNYSAEQDSHRADVITDAQGHASFRPRTLSASLARRVAVTLSSARAGVHASFGPHAQVFAFGDGFEGFDVDKKRNSVVDWTGKPEHMESRIVVASQKF